MQATNALHVLDRVQTPWILTPTPKTTT
jgi:hypothetical protein